MMKRFTQSAFIAMLFLLIASFLQAQNNIAPIATASAYGNQPPWNWQNINDLNYGTCGTQEAFVWTNTPPAAADYMLWEWTQTYGINKIKIWHAQTTGRFLTGGTIQRWDGSAWVNHYTFSNLNQANCENEITFPLMISSKLRINNFQMGTGQASNPNFREIEIFSMPLSGFDLAMESIVTPKTLALGNQDLTVQLCNRKADVINYCDIGYQVNNNTPVIVSNHNFTPPLSGADCENYTFTTPLNIPNPGYYTVKVWINKPNGKATDDDTSNDTLIWNACTAIQGAFTIGKSGTADFSTFGAAIAEMLNCGIAGDITFTVEPGTYNERVVIPEIPGAGANAKISFEGNGIGSTILTWTGTSTAQRATVVIDNVDYISFKDMTIQNDGAGANAMSVFLSRNASYNTFSNCHLKIPPYNSGTSICVQLSGSESSYSTASKAQHNLFEDCIIEGGYFTITVWGTGSTDVSRGNKFIGNEIIKSYYYGMYLYYQGSLTIKQNHLHDFDASNTNSYAIMSYYGTDNLFDGNIIQDMGRYGMYLYYENRYYPTESSKAINNMISKFTNTLYQYGMYCYYPYNLTIAHNTIWTDAIYTGTTYSYFNIGIYYYYQGNVIKNNILIADGNMMLLTLYGGYNPIEVDNNLYINNNSAYAKFYSNSGGYYYDLTTWQNNNYQIVFPHDLNSYYNIDPEIISKNNMHLLPGSKGLEGATLGITTDVDNDRRCSLLGYLGADEPAWTIPVVDFTYEDTMCLAVPVTFYNTVDQSQPHRARWLVNGIYKSNNLHFTYTFPDPGLDTVTLAMETCAGVDTIEKKIRIANPTRVPATEFVIKKNIIETNEEINLIDASGYCPNEWNWQITPNTGITFHNNTSTSSMNPVVSFSEPGTYSVCLTPKNAVGSGPTKCKNNYVIVKFSDQICVSSEGRTEELFGNLYDAGGKDGNHGTMQNCSYIIKPCGDEVHLVFQEFNLGQDAYLRLYDGINNRGIKLWDTINYPDGITGNMANPRFDTFFTAKHSGMAFVEFESDISDASGFNLEWSSTPGGFYPAPVANFEVEDTNCIVYPAIFTNTSNTDHSATEYHWDFTGNGHTDTNSIHGSYLSTFNGLSAKYRAKLVVENCGGYDTMIKEIIYINPFVGPKGGFHADVTKPVINQSIVTFYDDTERLTCVNQFQWMISPATYYFVNNTNQFSKHPQVIFMETTPYDVKVIFGNTNTTMYDTVEMKNYINPISYCNISVLNVVDDVGISRVKIGKIDHSSSIGVNGYNNFTNITSTDLIPDQSYDITMYRNTTYNAMSRKVWIDFNRDGDFDDQGELVVFEDSAYTQQWTASFTIPLDAELGATVMRVSSSFGKFPNEPCGPIMIGEVEDYRVVVSPDILPPVITIIGGDSLYIEKGETYVEQGAIAIDNLQGQVPVYISGNVDTNQVGLHYITYSACDSLGNCDSKKRLVFVTPDVSPPVITLIGGDPAYAPLNVIPYQDPGYTAWDNGDGDLTDQVIISGYVDPTTVGSYYLTYTVTDSKGLGDSKSRTVIIADVQAPDIQLLGDAEMFIEVMSGYSDPGVIYSDNYWPNSKITLQKTGTVDTTKIGTYTITYSVIDASGNGPNSVMRTVHVYDSTAPVITAKYGDVILVDVNTRFNDPGVDINDNSISGFTYNTSGTFYDKFPNGVPTELGNFTVFYQVIDAAGNESNVLGRIVKSVDVHPPVIELIGDPYIIVERWSNYVDQGYTLVGDNYYDNGDITITTENTVSTLKEGFYHVSYTAEDPSGNVSPTLTRLVKVEHNNTGIEDALNVQEIDIYPNPSSGAFNITVNLPQSKHVRISIENILGKEIRVIENAIVSQATYQVDLSNESDGVYMIRISSDNEVKTERIILNK